jgi:hypothetical protein
MLHGVKAGTFGEHPTGEDPLDVAVEFDLIHLDERRGVRRLRGRPRVTDSRRDLERSELLRLVNGDLERPDAARHLVERREHRNRVLDLLGRGRRRGSKNAEERKQKRELPNGKARGWRVSAWSQCRTFAVEVHLPAPSNHGLGHESGVGVATDAATRLTPQAPRQPASPQLGCHGS